MSFQANNTIFYNKLLWKNVNSTWRGDSNSQPSDYESPPLTTWPGLVSFSFFLSVVSKLCLSFYFSLSFSFFLVCPLFLFLSFCCLFSFFFYLYFSSCSYLWLSLVCFSLYLYFIFRYVSSILFDSPFKTVFKMCPHHLINRARSSTLLLCNVTPWCEPIGYSHFVLCQRWVEIFIFLFFYKADVEMASL